MNAQSIASACFTMACARCGETRAIVFAQIEADRGFACGRCGRQNGIDVDEIARMRGRIHEARHNLR